VQPGPILLEPSSFFYFLAPFTSHLAVADINYLPAHRCNNVLYVRGVKDEEKPAAEGTMDTD